MRKLKEKDVTFEIDVRPEWVQIEGNASAIDPETDAEIVRWIREQLDAGNEWAWCNVRMVARWEDFEGWDSLGCVSCESEEQFRDLYYDDMCAEALYNLNHRVAEVVESINALRVTTVKRRGS